MNRITSRLGAWLLLAVATGCGAVFEGATPHSDSGGLDAMQAFARMKGLAGTWSAEIAADPHADTAASATVPVEYLVTSGGHALQEKLFAGSDHEMVTMYFLEDHDLAMVHYCSVGNRPHMRLDRGGSTLDDLHFAWDGTATDIDPKRDAHIHEGRVHFVDAKTVECEWAFWSDGKEAERKSFTLHRSTGSFTPAAK